MSAAAADAAFLDAFDSGHSEGGVFGHRQHLRLAWILICRHGLDAATPEIERRLRDMAAAHGMPERYNRTLTLFWVRLVAHISERRPAATFAGFLDAVLRGAALERRGQGGVGRPGPHRDARVSRII